MLSRKSQMVRMDLDGRCQGCPGAAWTIEHYRQAASRLGQFNGVYLAGQPLPGEGWITQDWLRKYLEHAAPMVAFIRDHPSRSNCTKDVPGATLLLSLAIWDEYIRMLKVLDELPQTFCHQDAFERNLFSRGAQVVAVDWGYAGIAPLGAELAPLVGVASSLGRIPSSQLKNLDQACFEGYLEGLREAGFTPDARQVRLGYTITVLLRYILGATVGEVLPALLESEEARRLWAAGFGVAADKVEESEAGVAAYYQSISIRRSSCWDWAACMRACSERRSAFRLGVNTRQAGQAYSGTQIENREKFSKGWDMKKNVIYAPTIPSAEPFLFLGDEIGILLVHGFTGTPKEMRTLGEYLAAQGHTVLGIRLPGHATQPADLPHMCWMDWLHAVEDGYHFLHSAGRKVFIMGLSMGGILTLTAASRLEVKGAVAMSTPYSLPDDPRAVSNICPFVPLVPKAPAIGWHGTGACRLPAYREGSLSCAICGGNTASLQKITAGAAMHSRADGGVLPENMQDL
jgi:carboxylesterase